MSETIAKKAHIWARDPLEWYVEPTSSTDALLTVERFNGAVLDPCCGRGNIVETMRAAGYDAVGTDIVQRTGEAWFLGAADFNAVATISQPNIVMNPPFFKAKGTEAFIRKALSLAKGKVAVFTDLRFVASTRRANGLFREMPPHRVWVLTPRPSCPPGTYLAAGGEAKGGTADWCWMVWDLTAPFRGTSIDWLRGKP